MTFGDFVRLTRAYVWVLIGCTVLGALLMVAKTTREPVLYSATSAGLVQVGQATTAPEEQGNAWVKRTLANALPESVDELAALARRGFRRLQRHPAMIVNFFHHAGLRC